MLADALKHYARSIPSPGTTALEGEVPSEAHHVHLVARALAETKYSPVLEVYYDNPFESESGGGKAWKKVDLWAPSGNSGDGALFMEVKLALVPDATSKKLGTPGYGLRRAAEDWAWDIYRLLVGPGEHKVTCAFLLVVYTKEEGLLDGVVLGDGRQDMDRLEGIDADRVYSAVEALGSSGSSLAAIHGLTEIVKHELGGRVSRLGGPVRLDPYWVDPLLFEWRRPGLPTAG